MGLSLWTIIHINIGPSWAPILFPRRRESRKRGRAGGNPLLDTATNDALGGAFLLAKTKPRLLRSGVTVKTIL